MDKNLLKNLNLHRSARQAAIVLSDIATGNRLLLTEADLQSDAFEAETLEAIKLSFRDGKSRLIVIDGGERFINIYLPPTRLVVIGAVHISQYLAAIASDCGFDLEIIDPRTAFATPDRFGETKLRVDWPQTILAQSPLDSYCALIAVTHDPKIDDYAIKSALETGCFYVGALGSRKTHAKRLERLADEGLGVAQLNKIHAPIGLDIGAANPAEIAVAILAQVIQSFRRRELNL